MWDLLDISIPAVVLIPLVAIGAFLWVCFQQNARSSHARRAEFQRLQRLAMEEHDRAERERERDYMRHKDPHGMDHRGGDPRGGNLRGGGVEPHGADVRRRVQAGNGYGVDVGLGEWRDPDADARRRKQAEEEEQRRKQSEIELARRKAAAEAEEIRKHQEEIADRKRRENLDEEMRRRQADERRQAEEQEWLRRRADLEAQARREAEEELRRQAAEQGERPRGWKQESEFHKHEAANMSPRKVVLSSLNCAVCHKPTKVKRRCSRCKSMNYCSRECQVQHWSDGHKYECRPHDDTGASPRGSVDGDNRNYADFHSSRS